MPPTPADVRPTWFDFQITPQPDEVTCGSACLHAVYRHYGDDVALDELIEQVCPLPTGGTLTVFLALHALDRGYHATIYTCNLLLFDPTWFDREGAGRAMLRDRLIAQSRVKADPKLRLATEAYLSFLDRGGELRMEDITLELLARTLRGRAPIIAGLSATWLYRSMRERPLDTMDDDVAGEPLGHFVVFHGADPVERRVSLADPYLQKPYPGSHHYTVDANRAIGAVLLGIVTNDAKLLIIRPRE